MNILRTSSLVALWIGTAGCFHDPVDALSDATSAATSDATSVPASTSDSTLAPTTGTGASTTTATNGAGACGDGTIDPGEACDDGNAIDDDACTNACTAPACGDGVLQKDAGEQCDAGPDNGAGQACKADCTSNVCGDGDQGPGEACDDGNVQDGDGCTSTCQIAQCGDGVVQLPEQCDDANMLDDDTCTNACTLPACGDGIVQQGEQCDDANPVDDDACTNDCTLPPKLVFVSSMQYPGNLGGVAGADTKCQTLAMAANLPGTYLAWIANTDATTAPATRFTKSTGPYVRTDGMKIADDWTDLTDGTLDAPISLDEHGVLIPDETEVYTNVRTDGERKSIGDHCNNWTTLNAAGGAAGRSIDMGPGWTDDHIVSCSGTNLIYCFQQ